MHKKNHGGIQSKYARVDECLKKSINITYNTDKLKKKNISIHTEKALIN